jgi:hypothetical protein
MYDLIDNHFGWFVAVCFTAFVGGFIALAFWSDSAVCSAQTREMVMAHEWSFPAGCRVKTAQGWVPLNNYRVVGKQ